LREDALAIELITPEDVGLSSERLSRIPHYFSSYVDGGRLPCAAALVARGGQVAHMSFLGATEMGGKERIGEHTIYRIYSMTKPVTSVVAMQLLEESRLRLDHEVSRYIPEFADVMVWDGGAPDDPKLRKPDRPMLVRDLLLHTSGLTYAFLQQHPVDALYRARGLDYGRWQGDLASFCVGLAGAPLVFSPGERWNYSNATDVLGRVVEVAAGAPLDQVFKARIFDPLGMKDTGFHTPASEIDRLMACYWRNPANGQVVQIDPRGKDSSYSRPPNVFSGGGGLVSTIGDYLQFCLMLANGGAHNGVQILSPKTIEFMTLNHLPENRTIAQMGDKTFSETRMEGSGFGLGWAVTTDVVATTQPGSQGTFSWGGMASTFFWIDPVEDLIAIQMTQLTPSGSYPIRPQLQQLVYGAIID
jgi:CubicO group peptidase (beta-lactamase class C family)